MPAYTVALVLDPAFGERLKQLADRVHTWVVDTPGNRKVAELVWALEGSRPASIERGVTTFDAVPDVNPEEWCTSIVATIDRHHDEFSHHPGYSVLEVYGLRYHERLKPYFAELGFGTFENTDYGFRASKAQPNEQTGL